MDYSGECILRIKIDSGGIKYLGESNKKRYDILIDNKVRNHSYPIVFSQR